MVQGSKGSLAAIGALEAAGFEAYLVGGCVRDALRGVQPEDFDITTSALPEQVEAVFRDCRVVETGLRHGTVTVLLEGESLEITTYRCEGAYSDGRRPDQVRFVSDICEDLARRDFTMNAMAWHPTRGLVDPFGGQAHLRQGRIVCVGEPHRRFQEDGLRILRALRFSAVLGFAIDQDTRCAIFEDCAGLQRISAERVREELTKLLCGARSGHVLLDYADVLAQVLPPLARMKNFPQHNPFHIYDVLQHTAVALEQIPPEPVLRWSVLLHDAGKPDCHSVDAAGVSHFYGHSARSAELARVLLDELRFPRREAERIVQLVARHDLELRAEPPLLRRWLSRLTPPVFFDLLQLKRADILAQAPACWKRLEHCRKVWNLAQELLVETPSFGLEMLEINGHDLLKQGYRGREVGARLEQLLDAVLEGRIPNKRQALLCYNPEAEAGDRESERPV